jgi:predicted DCC family thiol-disulfide oxidoreductase YuxK
MEACSVDAEWIDIHRDPERLEEIGASQEFVRERLHVVDDSGAVRVGAEAIGALWSRTPRLRFLAALLRMPVITVVAGWAYNVFATGLYRWNRWRGRW